ncbi:MAG TPA: HlyD family efflux transporter periplasmic adaptor subunit [Vicinamibacterales bacterium]|nr:HlyD family efflux transporter periplasmic adaptor subunit [Vicinamibacterales bacterium]
MRRRAFAAAAAVIAVAAVLVFARARTAGAGWFGATTAARAVPTARVQRGTVEVTVHTLGDLRAARSAQLSVPPMGGQLQIIQLVDSGAAVKAGEVVVAFDAAEQEFNLEQARFDLQLADQDLIKADAQAVVQQAEDEVALLHARYDVRRAELEAQKNEIVSDIQKQQNLLALEEAKQRLAQLEADVKTHRATNDASAAGLRAKKDKAALAVQVAERNIESLRIAAPFDGYATVRTNFQAFGGIVFSAAAMPEYRVGDATFAGQPIVDVIDTSQIEVTAKLSEQDRANVAAGNSVEVAVDAVPDAKLRGSVRAVSGVASRGIFDAGTRQFDISFDVTGAKGVRPGVSAAIAIAGPTFENVLYVPRTAVFEVAGKPTVYVRGADGFDAREVRVKAWTDSVAIVENLDASAEVALVNPNSPSGSKAKPQAPAAPQRASR